MPVWVVPLLGRLLGSKYTWIAAGVVTALTAAFFYVHSLENKAAKAATTAVISKVQDHTVKVQKAITRAEQAGPRTQSEAEKSLQEGTF